MPSNIRTDVPPGGSATTDAVRQNFDVTRMELDAAEAARAVLAADIAGLQAALAALHTIASSGDYGDLTNLPALSAVAISGSYNDLSNSPVLAAVATSGNYGDLADKPSLGTAAALDAGIGALEVVQLDNTGRLPAVDGSQLTGIAAAGAQGQVRLVHVDATHIRLDPYGGGGLAVDGTSLGVPAGGVTIDNSGLLPDTTYYVYAYENLGAVAIELSSTGHANTAGYEHKSLDPSRALVGMVRADAATQFQDDATNRLVLSWFNRRPRRFYRATAASAGSTSTSWVEIHSDVRVPLLCWHDQIEAAYGTVGTNSMAAGATEAALVSDPAGALTVIGRTSAMRGEDNSNNVGGQLHSPLQVEMAEGYHLLGAAVRASGGSTATHSTASSITGWIWG